MRPLRQAPETNVGIISGCPGGIQKTPRSIVPRVPAQSRRGFGPFPLSTSHGLAVSSVTRFAPLFFFQLYLIFSLLLFTFGPLDLRVDNPLLFYGFVLSGHLAIWVGYSLGARTRVAEYSQAIRLPTIAQLSFIASCIILAVAHHYRNYGGISFLEALDDPSVAYYARLEQYEFGESTSWLYSVIRGCSGPLLALFTPIGIVYWRRMDSLWRTIWIIGLLLYLSDSILSGAAKGMFDILLVLPWLLCVRTTLDAGNHHPPGKPAGAPRRRKPRYLLVGIVSAVILIGGFRYFTHSRASRYGIAGNEKGYPSGTTGWSQELYGVKIPESAEFMVYMVARYWTHGYYGLAGCLELPFEWSHGVGHSVIWMKYAASLTNDPEYFWRTCYPARLEAATGYSTAHYWHTIYPWIASDLTFPGAIVFVGLMGYLLAQVWSETLRGANPFALGFLTQVMLLFYYVPANNCRLMYAEEAITFWGLLAAWRMTRR